MPIVPSRPRFQIETDNTGMRIFIPNRKNWYVILTVVTWLILFISIPATTAKNMPDAFWGDQLTILLLFGGIGIAALLWQFTGKERILITNTSITTGIGMLGFSFPREYEAQYIKDLRVSQPFDTGRPALIEPGIIAFDYGARTFRFGRGCEEAEAKMILAEIAQRYPQYLPVETGKE